MAGNVSAASTGLVVTIDTTAAAPVVTGITTDAGAADGITNDTTLLIAGTAEAGASVQVFKDAVSIGTTTANAVGVWSFDHTGTVLAAGAHVFTARQTDVAGNVSATSGAFNVTIDTSIPAAPGAPDLAASSDLGFSNTDNLTSSTTPTFTGTGETGATVTLFDTNGATVLGTGVVSGAGAWTITSSVLAAGAHTLTARQTDVAGNVSVASTGLVVTIDTTRPGTLGASFVGGSRAITMDFTEAVTAGSGDMSLVRNPSQANNFNGTALAIDSVGGSGTTTLTINTAAASPVLIGTDFVRVRFNQNGADVVDLAGNRVSSREHYVGGNGDNTIDLSNYSNTSFVQILRGNGGNDTLIGTNAADNLIDGGGLDTLTGGRGADTIRLVETIASVNAVRDIVNIGLGHSTASAMDLISGSTTNAGTAFDITSTTAANHDILNLQSNVIAANVTNADGTDVGALATHSIASGILTFQNSGNAPILINTANLSDAIAYLSANINAPGTTVAFRVDDDNSGTIVDGVDALYVFQDNGTIPLSGNFVVPDTVVKLDQLIGIASATLGATAGANVVQLQDTTAPEPLGFALTGNGFSLNFAENTFATPGIALSLKQNGIGADMTFTGLTGNGSTALTITTGTTLAASDFVLLKYSGGASAGNSLSDTAGNLLPGDAPTDGGSALGSSVSNTIDLSNAVNFAATGGYELVGFGGNDTLIGSAVRDNLGGGAGADLMTGGGGIDFFRFEQGDSPVGVVNLGAGVAGILDNGDTFVFAGGVDRITDFITSGEGINLDVPNQDFANTTGLGWMGAQGTTPATAVLPTNGLATDQGFFLVQGGFSGTTFTVNNTGADTLVVYDGDSTAGVTQTGIVLSGVTLAQLNAFTGSNFISHL